MPVQRPERQSPTSLARGNGAFNLFYMAPSCLTPPRSQSGFRAKNCEAMIVKGADKSKKTHLSPAFAKASVFAGATPDRMAGQAESAGNAECEGGRQVT